MNHRFIFPADTAEAIRQAPRALGRLLEYLDQGIHIVGVSLMKETCGARGRSERAKDFGKLWVAPQWHDGPPFLDMIGLSYPPYP
jgi:hypothetical protein